MKALVALVALTTPAAAGAFWPGAGRSYRPADCTAAGLLETRTDVPAWSRLSWSFGYGIFDGPGLDRHLVLTAQASAALWLRERRCTPDAGALVFGPSAPWLRWSVAVSGDAVWRVADDDGYELRPALRVARARMNDPLFRGSVWTPDREWFATLGPTFDPAWSGGGASVGYRVAALAVELRINVLRERATEGFVMFALADLHGVAPLGRTR